MVANVKVPVTSVDVKAYKESMAHWATGVSVVTAVSPEDGRFVGITVSSLTSLSVDPPEILISLSKSLFTHGAILASGRFAASILRAEQAAWGMRFAGMVPEVDDRFAGIETISAVTGCPILVGALAWLDCTVLHTYDGEDHTILVGKVVAAGRAAAGEPLLYYDRNWRTLAE